MPPVRIRDLMAAEEQLDQQLDALRELRSPDSWTARESLAADGRKSVHVSDAGLRYRELIEQRVVQADQHLRSLQRAFAAGADLGGPPAPLAF